MCTSRSAFMRTGQRTAGNGAPRARVALLILLAGASLGGCSTPAPLPGGGIVSALVSAPSPHAPSPADGEKDEREAQRPPPVRMFARPDDPTQPFSPNYGEVPLPQQPEDADAGEEPPAPA